MLLITEFHYEKITFSYKEKRIKILTYILFIQKCGYNIVYIQCIEEIVFAPWVTINIHQATWSHTNVFICFECLPGVPCYHVYTNK